MAYYGVETADKTQFTNLTKQFQLIQQQAKATGNTGKAFLDIMADAAKKFASWYFVGNYIAGINRQLKQMVDIVIALDQAMLELRKVTNLTEVGYVRAFTAAARSADKLGASIRDVITATADFARLGYNLTDSQALAEAAVLYKNVGDGIKSINDSTTSITATMKAFGIEASDSVSIVDRFTKVGNEFSINSKGIGDGLLNSASSLAAANNSLDQSIGLIVAANETIQDPDKIGNALKVISMRIRGAKEDLEEFGESTEGMAESTSKLRDQMFRLSGVDIMIDASTFKSTFDIIDELSEKWDSLSDITQANITELIAGKTRGDVVSSLIDNFDTARDAVEAAANSMGAAWKANEKYLESIGGKMSLFGAQFAALANNVIDSNFIKVLVDAGTKLLTTLNQILDTFGTFPVVFTTIVAAASKFKNVGSNMPSYLKAA